MKARVPQTVIKPDYRQFRLRKLNTPEFSHIKLLLFWPVFGLAFLALERFRPHAAYPVLSNAFRYPLKVLPKSRTFSFDP